MNGGTQRLNKDVAASDHGPSVPPVHLQAVIKGYDTDFNLDERKSSDGLKGHQTIYVIAFLVSKHNSLEVVKLKSALELCHSL